MFICIVFKLLSIGHKIKDKKIRIVYETYREIADQYDGHGRICSWSLYTMMILVPPEFSFIFVKVGSSKYKSGYYQV